MENHLTEKELNSTSNISNISVKEFLEYVNSVSTEFADTLSDDVLENLGNIKSEKPSINVRFSLSAPVEETKELVAVHNMKSSELLKTLDLGGLPMPSIAIIKAQSGHSEYGDVSVEQCTTFGESFNQ